MRRAKKGNREKWTVLLFLAPYLLGLFSFYVIPFIISIAYTFTRGTGFTGRFVGLENYAAVFASEPFQLAAKNTFRFLAVSVPLVMVLSFLIASALYKKFRGARLFRSIFLFPLVVPVGSIVMFVQIFLLDKGVLYTLLEAWGLLNSAFAMGDEGYFWLLVFLYVWRNCGYNIILFLAGFNYIPHEYYENAQMMGAGSWTTMRYVTLPMMKNSFFFVFILSIVNVFKSFREAYMIGGTHPPQSIYMLQHFMTNNFTNLNYQRLSVASLCVFLVIFVLVFFLYRSWNKSGVQL